MTNINLKTQIDTDITNKTTSSSITPSNVGDNMKDIVDYVDQEVISTIGAPGPIGPQGVEGPQGPAGLVGPAGLHWQGTWLSGTSYALNDAVGYNGA